MTLQRRDWEPLRYGLWWLRFGRPSRADRAAIHARVDRLRPRPTLSLVMSTRGAEEPRVRRAVESTLAQLYPDWSLAISVGPWTEAGVRRTVEAFARHDSRVHLVHAEPRDVDPSGDFVGALRHDAELTVHALYLMVEAANAHPHAQLIYSDDDRIDEHGSLGDPQFKPDFSPDLLRSRNYIGHLTLFRTDRIRAVGGFGEGSGGEDLDLLLRFTERLSRENVVHVPFVIHHAPARVGTAEQRASEKVALRRHLERMSIDAEVLDGPTRATPQHRVRYRLPPSPPLVSLIIGTRDKVELMRTVCAGVLENTDYTNFELIVVDNGSTDRATLEFLAALPKRDARARVIRHDAPFNFSEINNLGVRAAKGSVIGLLNNDLEVIRGDWLGEMVSHALRPEVGIVGARLLYADGTVQHAGVVTGIGEVAGHLEKGLARDAEGHLARPNLIGDFSAVTAACIVMRRAVFDEVGGLDEKNLTVAFNDVDLCLKVRERGYWIVYTPHAELYHLESKSRGADTTEAAKGRFGREIAFMVGKWGSTLPHDPFYNPNLSGTREKFALANPPRTRKPWRD